METFHTFFNRVGRRLSAQTFFLSIWNSKISPQAQNRLDVVRLNNPYLFRSTADAIEFLSPMKCGEFYSMLCTCAGLLAVFLLQNPSQSQLNLYCAELKHFMLQCCYNNVANDFDMDEFAMFILTVMYNRPRVENGQSREALDASYLPLDTVMAMQQAQVYVQRIPQQCISVLLFAHKKDFRHHLNWVQFFNASRGFMKDPARRGTVPSPRLPPATEFVPDILDESFRPSGPRVSISEFCAPIIELSDYITCSICMDHMEMTDMMGKQPVITICKHAFHQACLDHWVNDSCANSRNKCPACRTEICRARPRVPIELPDEWPENSIPVRDSDPPGIHGRDHEDEMEDEAPDWPGIVNQEIWGNSNEAVELEDGDEFLDLLWGD